MEICALAGVRFHPVHGLTLNIFEIDPAAGESRVERNRREILELLDREGLLQRNRELSLIAAPLRIGLITSPNSAALADFVHTLQASPFAFEVVLVTAAMQGEDTARTVTHALEYLSSRNLDLICIIRGGGSPLDLAWLDDIGIARAAALCPVPVWMGIGHEVDVGVLDHVAHTSHKTPTAVAKVLVRRLEALDERLQSGAERLQEMVTRRLELARRDVARLDEGLRQGARKHLEIRLGQFLRAAAELETALTGTARSRNLASVNEPHSSWSGVDASPSIRRQLSRLSPSYSSAMCPSGWRRPLNTSIAVRWDSPKGAASTRT